MVTFSEHFEIQIGSRRISIARNKKSPNACNQLVREELLEFLSRENYEGSECLSTLHYVKILKFSQSKKEVSFQDSSIEQKNFKCSRDKTSIRNARHLQFSPDWG